MAIGVVLSSFVLCGAFLLTAVTFLVPTQPQAAQETVPEPEPQPDIELPVCSAEVSALERVAALLSDGPAGCIHCRFGEVACLRCNVAPLQPA